MANPQKENGYVPIANEIFEALCKIRISGETRQVVDTVFRKTYGFNKKQDAISLSQFCLSTGMRKQDVIRGLNKAYEMNLIKLVSKKAYGKGNVYSINKDFDTWKPLAKKLRGMKLYAKKLTTVSKKAYNRKQKSDIQKTVSKDTLTKDKENGDKSPEPAQYGNPAINEVIETLKQSVTLMDGSERENRNFAKLLLDKIRKKVRDPDKNVDAVKFIINAAAQSSFHSKNATSMKYIYYHAGKILEETKKQNSKTLEINL